MKTVVLNVSLILALVLSGYWLHSQNSKAEKALCTLKADLVQRQRAARRYLDELDAGQRKPIPGVTRADIQNGLDNQQRTITALSILDCN